MAADRVQVGLFVTCLVDTMRPQIGFAAVRLLEEAGCRVTVPPAQTCCGQPAHNAGDQATAAAIALGVIDAFQGLDYVVAPSASCAGMIRNHFPTLFADDAAAGERARALAGRTFELVSFLVDVMGVEAARSGFEGTVAYHDSCAALREMGVREQPRRLLGSLKGVRLSEPADGDVCCGFGGAFCVKYPDISNAMVSTRTNAIAATRADTVVSADLGCLLNIAGRLSRQGIKIRARHVAEILADMANGPAIGEPTRD